MSRPARYRQRTLALLVVLIVLALLVEALLHPLRRLYDNLVLDNRGHYLSCRSLPPIAEVERTMAAHQGVLEDIQNVHPGFVVITMDSYTCPGRADILIEYPSHQDRVAIEGLIGGDSFFGIPFRLRNY